MFFDFAVFDSSSLLVHIGLITVLSISLFSSVGNLERLTEKSVKKFIQLSFKSSVWGGGFQ